jgi:uncharacterized protein
MDGGRKMKRVVVAGGSGFIGKAILSLLKSRGYETVVLSRGGKPVPGADRVANWNGKDQGDWTKELDGAYGVINLVGESIMTLFTPEAKRALRDSRVHSTHALAQAIAAVKNPPQAWVNASAMGFYGDTGDRMLAESAPKGKGFLPDLCEEWEKAMEVPPTPGVRKSKIRVGMVLGRGGGAFQQLSLVTKAFAGSALGDGRQWVSWIHLDDLAEMFLWALENDEVSGILNGGSPTPVTNSEFMAAFREAFGRPPVPPAPAFMVRLVAPLMKVEGDLLLSSQRMLPVMPLAKGFKFRHTGIRGTLESLVEAPV